LRKIVQNVYLRKITSNDTIKANNMEVLRMSREEKKPDTKNTGKAKASTRAKNTFNNKKL